MKASHMHGIKRRREVQAGGLPRTISLRPRSDFPKRSGPRGAQALCLLLVAILAPLPIGGFAWAATIEAAAPRRQGGHKAFHLTSLEVISASAMIALVAAAIGLIGVVYAIRTYNANHRERAAKEKSASPLEQARAAKAASAELSAFRSAVADADWALRQLQQLRSDNKIPIYRELRLANDALAPDNYLAATYQRLLRRLMDICSTMLERVVTLDELIPLAAVHQPLVFTTDVMNLLANAESALQRILSDKKMPLEQAEGLIAQISTATFQVTGERPSDPQDLSDL